MGTARGPVHSTTILIFIAVVCLSVAVLAYRAEIDATEVRIRYAPFYTRRIPIRDVTSLVEERTLFLVTQTARMPLWGLSPAARKAVFRVLPHQIDVVPSGPNTHTQIDSAVALRHHARWAILAGVAFVVTTALVIPFLHGNPLQDHWNSVGKHLLLLWMGFFGVVVFEAGFIWVLWSSKRDFDKIEKTHDRS
jgi:hypothetical protein